jgi:hypothetical protein
MYDASADSCLNKTTPPTPSSGVSQATFATCYTGTGLPETSTDANGAVTTYSYDSMLRPAATVVTNSGGVIAASTGTTYSGSTLPETITTTISASPNLSQITKIILDGLGRPIKELTANGAETDTIYNSIGKVQSQSNPYLTTSDSAYGITSYIYDGLGRETFQCQPDNGTSPVPPVFQVTATRNGFIAGIASRSRTKTATSGRTGLIASGG